MFDKLDGIAARYEAIERSLADNAILSDYSKVAALAQERAELQPIVEAYRQYQRAQRQRAEAQALLESERDPELRAMAREEITSLEAQIEALEAELKRLLLPKDPRDEKNVILEIRAGTGGEEAGLFAADLLRMYMRYAESKGWETEILSANESGIGGYSTVIVFVKGRGAFSRLKYESGVHRVQRVPITESQGRIHTSTATVAVLAEMDEVDVHIDPKDVIFEVRRSQGAGGQSVNTTDSAVRLTHIPTGIVVDVQDERKQLQNRIKAMNILRARLYEMQVERQRQEQDSARRSQVGTGERSEKIRTYNFPQNRVTDHRIGKTMYNLAAFLDGEIDAFIDELATREQAEKLGMGMQRIATTDED
ncbi:MAG: peptide chain release factor 1 [Candidatus Thermofonsia Clade 1 bacterium]|jgi:peptide chain release factor 1|uniref:Peptide chain release factor 1 n=1 Tax=Candidatus Thermofonsia Clade 1 bacterium TaxID=2364210 RepID=A0A2M8PZH6_9CHLR|nr:MAG: peptide chain release factor 1 [Candidatus Thermofonsia Clade 1 bacterium]PJF42949.1 MAG: peptide chain release factor 1 [Candidatus Thermofonsia Clade 1 bacterium]RMF53411.1 MAG: peptide chain release factor 1 [Chloroflexota bacterium]